MESVKSNWNLKFQNFPSSSLSALDHTSPTSTFRFFENILAVELSPPAMLFRQTLALMIKPASGQLPKKRLSAVSVRLLPIELNFR
jgi:hypothetical protein